MCNPAVVREEHTQIWQIDDDLPRLTCQADGVRVALALGEERETAKADIKDDHEVRSPVGGAAWPLVSAFGDACGLHDSIVKCRQVFVFVVLMEISRGWGELTRNGLLRGPTGGIRRPYV